MNQSAAFWTRGTNSTSHISAAFQAHPLLATGSRAFSSEALLGSVPPQIQTGSTLTDHCPAHTRSPWMRRPCTHSPGRQAEAGSTLGTSKLSAPMACSTQGNRQAFSSGLRLTAECAGCKALSALLDPHQQTRPGAPSSRKLLPTATHRSPV